MLYSAISYMAENTHVSMRIVLGYMKNMIDFNIMCDELDGYGT